MEVDKDEQTSKHNYYAFLDSLDCAYWKNSAKPEPNELARLAEQFKVYVSNADECGMTDIGGLIFYMVMCWPETAKTQRKNLADKMVAFLEKWNEREVVPSSHGIVESSLTHDFDLHMFCRSVDSVFDTFYNLPEDKKEDIYSGPYFVFVQSSGMGKTKILYEYKKQTEAWQKDANQGATWKYRPEAKIVLCRAKRNDEEKNVYDNFLQLKSTEEDSFEANRSKCFDQLDKLVEGMTNEYVVLMFDEAQYLLGKGSYSNGLGTDKDEEKMGTNKVEDAFLFRLVRLWLCWKRVHKIVAVFSGTTAKLKNFIIEDDLERELQTDSREASTNEQYYSRGKNMFMPFFTTTTIGCLRMRQNKLEKMDKSLTEHEAAVPYGRPLFATMSPSDYQAFLPIVLKRMVLSEDQQNWKNNKSVWLNILGTRVQMGQTSFEIASKLVAGAYMNIVGLQNDRGDVLKKNSAQICYMPDPVCARLAMCLMDENWSMTTNTGKTTGQAKTWWVSRMKEIFANKICTPEKGDLGEVMVALYFLFCADIIRGEADSDYSTFSVPLEKWIDKLVSGGCESTQGHNQTAKLGSSLKQVTFGAIQVCRNYLRLNDFSWTSLGEKDFLKNLYKSGVGFYVFPGCSTIDLVFPLWLAEKDQYLPMLVSVKSHVYFGPSAAKKECEAMAKRAEEAKSEHNQGVLCILAIFGSETKSNAENYELD